MTISDEAKLHGTIDDPDLLRAMRCNVVCSHVATMPIPLYERMKAALLATGEVVEQQWLPIESAPKDGTDVLTTDGKQIDILRWIPDKHWAAKRHGGAGWFEPYTLSCKFTATHWMPIPTTPTTDKEPV